MTHEEIVEKEIIERYVLQQLTPDERLAFQQHYFGCDECFEQVQMEARFIAATRQASRAGVLAAGQSERSHIRSRFLPVLLAHRWAMPALVALLLVALAVVCLWALSLRRENQLLAGRMAEQSRASERQTSEDQELEGSDSGLREQAKSLKQENSRLKEQLAESERQHEAQLAELKEPDVNVPIRNIYPVGDQQRSAQRGGTNRVRVPRGTRSFLLILGDYKPGYQSYRLEIRDAIGQVVARLSGLKPDQAGDLSVMLTRTLLGPGKYRLKLYGGQEPLAEYDIQVE